MGRFTATTRRIQLFILFAVTITTTLCFARDPLKQPFHRESIWNMPNGSDAEDIHAHIQPANSGGMTVDEDVIVLTPDAPVSDI